mgnify:FL=1
MKYQNLISDFSILLKKVGEGKISQELIDEMIKRRLDDDDKEQSLKNLGNIDWEFRTLSNMFVISVLKYKDEQKKKLKPSKEVNLLQTYSIEETSQYLKVSKKTLYNYMNAGKIGFVQISDMKRLITQGQINGFLERSKV